MTQVYAFESFTDNKFALKDYFYSAPNRPFCETYIKPKLNLLLARFKRHVNQEKIAVVGPKTS